MNDAKLVLGADTIADLNRQGGELLVHKEGTPPPPNPRPAVPVLRRKDDTRLTFVRLDLETLGFTLLEEPGRTFRNVLALFDTGSARTMVRYSILRTLEIPVVPKPELVLTAANGSKIDVLGEARINICCAEFKFEIVVVVVTEAHSPFPVIFGADLIRRICDTGHTIGVDVNAGRVHIDGHYFSTQVFGLPAGQHRVNRVKIRINGRQVEALFDTGCTLTFCSESAAKELKMRPSPAQPETKTAVTATGDRMFFGKSAFAKINLQHREIYHRIYVTRDEHSPAPVVLGTDIMQVLAPDNTISLDFGRRKVTFATETLDFVNLILDEQLVVKDPAIRLELLRDTIVGPRTDMVAPVCFRTQPKPDALYLVTEKPHRYTIKVGGSLHQVNADQRTDERFHIWIRVLNLGGNEVLLKARSVVAQAEEVSPEHVTEPVFEVNSVTTTSEREGLEDHRQQRKNRRPPTTAEATVIGS
ncbi:hypothetical protein AAVH_25811 [Aphelenchoides avenae]|nr:hypothetical protein AAVH_25811 [Aphelenchus avenae]